MLHVCRFSVVCRQNYYYCIKPRLVHVDRGKAKKGSQKRNSLEVITSAKLGLNILCDKHTCTWNGGFMPGTDKCLVAMCT